MTKKFSKRVREPLSPKPVVKQEDTANLVREDLDEQQERLSKAEAAGAGAVRTPAPPAPPEQPPAPATVPSKPLAPLGALWPSSVPPQGEATPSQGPAPAPAPPSPKPAVRWEPTQSPGKAAVVAEAPMLSEVPTVKVTFVFPICQCCAKRVSLSGDFNGWSPDATPMQRYDDGHWETTVELAPGRYQYKLIVDGEWIVDPAAQKNVPNEHGSLNSVIEVRA